MQSSSWVDVNMISSEASSVVIDIAQYTQKKTQTVRPPNLVPYVQKRLRRLQADKAIVHKGPNQF